MNNYLQPDLSNYWQMAENIKSILSYAFWISISIIMGFVHMFVVLGPNTAGTEGIDFWFDMIYKVALIKVGGIVGLIIAFLFLLVDNLLLKKSPHFQKHTSTARIVTILVLTVVVGVTHYLLEKTIDLI